MGKPSSSKNNPEPAKGQYKQLCKLQTYYFHECPAVLEIFRDRQEFRKEDTLYFILSKSNIQKLFLNSYYSGNK